MPKIQLQKTVDQWAAGIQAVRDAAFNQKVDDVWNFVVGKINNGNNVSFRYFDSDSEIVHFVGELLKEHGFRIERVSDVDAVDGKCTFRIRRLDGGPV